MLEIIVTGIACLLIGVLIGGFIEWNNAVNLEEEMVDRIDDLQRWNRNQKQQISEKQHQINVLQHKVALLHNEVERLESQVQNIVDRV